VAEAVFQTARARNAGNAAGTGQLKDFFWGGGPSKRSRRIS
jgi:hypothetical protein